MPANIRCKWIDSRRIVVNPDGQVVPCCYFANRHYINKGFKYTVDGDILDKYNKAAGELNAFNNPIDEIVNHKWFDELYESWNDSSTVSKICVKHCSINK